MKVEIKHELAKNPWHGHRVRLRFAELGTKRIARAVVKEVQNFPGITDVQANYLTHSLLFYADSAEQKKAVLDYLENSFDWRQHTGITAEEVEDLLTGENPEGAWIGVARFFLLRPFLPQFWRIIVSTASAVPFITKGMRAMWRGRLNVDVLDASALAVSIMMKDTRTVGLLSMLLAVGDALEVWTRQRSMDSLTESLALNVDNVWMLDQNGKEINVPLGHVQPGDLLVVNAGASIPVDGIVHAGNAMVNQAAMTGEPMPVAREKGGAVYAGTIVEAGRLVIRVKKIGEGTRLHQVVSFIRQSEMQKSKLEAHYTKLADKVVPITFGLAGIVLLATGSLMRAASVLLVDYSCALKLATPLAVLSAMRNGTQCGMAIRGGKYLEAIKEADTLVFDKTGTLTSSRPEVAAVIPAPGWDRRKALKIMACLEEHFPHPVSRAVVNKALEEHVGHEEEHTEVEYVVAHGIVSTLHGHHMRFGSRHFIEHDEGCDLSVFNEDIERESALGRSLLFLSEDGKPAGMVAIEDPLRPEAPAVIAAMRKLGFKRILMLTGDDERTAKAVAKRAGIDEYRAQILPEGKGRVIQQLNAEGCHVMMVGDGINDGPALSTASVGVAMGDGTDLARAVANVLLTRPNLTGLVIARLLSTDALARIHFDVNLGIGLNSLYLLGAALGVFSPGLTAILHNTTTIGIALNAIRPYAVQHELVEAEKNKSRK